MCQFVSSTSEGSMLMCKLTNWHTDQCTENSHAALHTTEDKSKSSPLMLGVDWHVQPFWACELAQIPAVWGPIPARALSRADTYCVTQLTPIPALPAYYCLYRAFSHRQALAGCRSLTDAFSHNDAQQLQVCLIAFCLCLVF